MKLILLIVLLGIGSAATFGAEPASANFRSSQENLGSRMFLKFSEQDRDSNVVLSPHGMAEVLAILETTTSAESRDAVRQTLRCGLTGEALSAAVSELRSSGQALKYVIATGLKENGGYGLLVSEVPAPNSALHQAKIARGDLIFGVNEDPVRQLTDLQIAAGESRGTITVSGYSLKEGLPFLDRQITLDRVRDIINIRTQPLVVCNLLCVDRRIPIRKEFAAYFEQHSVKSVSLNFSDRQAASQLIQSSLAQGTANRLGTYTLPEVKDQTRFMIINALTMEAQWQRRFSAPVQKRFQTPKEERNANFMSQSGAYRFADFETYSALEVPFRDSSLVMWFILPKHPQGWREMSQSGLFASKTLMSIQESLKMEHVDVSIPTFRVRDRVSGKRLFPDAAVLFSDKADFSPLSQDRSLKLDDIDQDVFLEVNELGTKAGSVTTATGIAKSLNEAQRKFHATHPFFAIIRDQSGGTFFVARITTPN